MTPSPHEKMNTKYAGHHISSGGFVFFEDPRDGQVYVALIRNKYNQWCLPKGHIESWENYVQCAFREIEEETGIPQDQLEYIDFCYMDSYEYDDDGHKNTKSLYISVFCAKTKFELIKHPEETDQLEVAWVKFEDALDIIAFNRKELIKSKEIFDQKQ